MKVTLSSSAGNISSKVARTSLTEQNKPSVFSRFTSLNRLSLMNLFMISCCSWKVSESMLIQLNPYILISSDQSFSPRGVNSLVRVAGTGPDMPYPAAAPLVLVSVFLIRSATIFFLAAASLFLFSPIAFLAFF